MTRRLRVRWPDGDRIERLGRPLRILAVSDDEEPALEREENRAALGPIDLVVGCGDLSADYLSFLSGTFAAPLLYVRGNHDRGGAWDRRSGELPQPVGPGGVPRDRAAGLHVIGLSWPGRGFEERQPNELQAWLQALRAFAGAVLRSRGSPVLVLSHVPPLGVGDMPDSNYHRGFAGYRWLLRRLAPPLWLHGHVHPAATAARSVRDDGCEVVNVTGATLVELTAE